MPPHELVTDARVLRRVLLALGVLLQHPLLEQQHALLRRDEGDALHWLQLVQQALLLPLVVDVELALLLHLHLHLHLHLLLRRRLLLLLLLALLVLLVLLVLVLLLLLL